MKSYLFYLALIAGVAVLAGCGGGSGGPGGDGDTSGPPADSATRIFGKVFDASTEGPLANVRVTVAGVTGSVVTDAQGRFAFPVPAAGTYALTATLSGYTYAQRQGSVVEGQLASVRDMFLTPLDSAVIRIGSAGGTGSNSDDSIQLQIPRDALRSATDMRATWYHRGKHLPNALPTLSHWTYACELTPEGQTFDQPVTIRMRNTRGFAPGTEIPVGVYSSSSLTWTHESMGRVSADGQWVEFQIAHFSTRDCNLGRRPPSGSDEPGDATDISDEAGTDRNNQTCGSISGGSLIGVADGHLSVDHVLPAYRSLDQLNTVALQYNSHKVSALPTIGLLYDISQTRVETPARMKFVVSIGGQRMERYFTPVEGSMLFSYRWDGRDGLGRDVPDGQYEYEMTLVNEYQAEFATAGGFGEPATGGTGVTADEYVGFASVFTGTVTLDRSTAQWPYGRGWGIVGLYRLRANGNKVTITGGQGTQSVFTADGAGAFTAADGDFSQLTANADGTYAWTHQDHTAFAFDPDGQLVTRTDRNGNATAYAYDTSGRLISITDPLGRVTTLAYNGSGQLASITDPHGRLTQFEVDGNGDLVRITNPDSSVRRFAYNSDHYMTGQTDAGGSTTTYTYDGAAAVTRVDYADGTHSEYTAIASYGRINSLAPGAGTETSPASIANSTYTDGEGNTSTFTVNAFGTRTSITGPLGRVVTMERNRHDQITTLRMPSEKFTAYEYDARGNISEISGHVRNVGVSDSLSISYDDTHNVPTAVADDTAGTMTQECDANGNVTVATTMDGVVYTYAYNARGRRTSLTVDGRTTTYAYNADGNLATVTDPGGGIWTYTYDTYGNIATLTDPDGRTVTMSYNVMNLPTAISNAVGDTVSFAWSPAKGSIDLAGQGPVAVVTGITDGRGHTTTYGHDTRWRITSVTDPLGNVKLVDYDDAGRVTSIIEPNGSRVDFTFDAAGQLTQKVLDGSETYTYTYDGETGLLETLTAPTCRLDIEYDWYDIVSSVTTTFLPSDAGVDVTYDNRASNYQETALTVSAGGDSNSFGYEYSTPTGWRATDMFAGATFWFDLGYDASGRLTDVNESYSWVELDIDYDSAGRATRKAYAGVDSAAISLEYSDGGFVTRLTDPDGDHTYTYDTAGRLTGATHPTGDNPAETYSYDAAGNRRVAGSEAGFTFDDANRLTADPTFDYMYDDSGNLLTKRHRTTGQTTTYTYNAENRLTQIAIPGGPTISFSYDALGRLCEKQVAAAVTRYVYDRDQVIVELDASNALVRQYANTTRIDRLLGIKIGGLSSPDNYIFTTDHLGSVLQTMDDDGLLSTPYRYQAFGRLVRTGGVADNRRTFAGRDYVPDASLYYMRYRFYDPSTGRFLQRDPDILHAASAPYVYAGNNPVNSRDPYGLDPVQRGTAQGWAAFQDRISNPAINGGISNGLGLIPDGGLGIAGPAGTVYGTYQPWMDLIRVFRSDNPAQAGLEWYEGRWWNPAAPYMDDFLTFAGTFERRDARIHRICGLSSGLRSFFSPQLHGSR